MQRPYIDQPVQIVKGQHHEIAVFSTNGEEKNIDQKVVDGFGEEWKKFYQYTEEEINTGGSEFFDILTEQMVNKNSYVIDIGCGNGRWSKYLASKVGFIEAIDPSNAIFVADKLLADTDNVRLTKASTDTIPFADNTFDFGMSVGVLHHIPDTEKAMADCVKKVKSGGYFYAYLYYKLDDRGFLFRTLFSIVSFIRFFVSRLPSAVKKFVCDVIAFVIYMPPILTGRLFKMAGLKKWAEKMPLAWYQNKTFFIIRNDSLDRFGTKLEHRYTKKEVREMMQKAGLTNITIADTLPCWHAVGEKL